MKRYILSGLALIACLMLLIACGGGNGSNGVVTQSSVTPAPTQAPQPVTVTLTDTAIQSSITTFSANKPYSFTVTNKGTSAHDFIIDRTTSSATVTGQTGPRPTSTAESTTLHVVSSKQLTPGATVTFTYSFSREESHEVVQFSEHLAGPTLSQGPTLPIRVQ